MSAIGDKEPRPAVQDLSDWMSRLDVELHDVPLNNLAIPGTSLFSLKLVTTY